MNETFGIYIHFPYCRRKCIYCDFYSVGERLADWEGFASAVENEFKTSALKIPEDATVTLYLGGGTPSLAPVEVIDRFRRMIPNPVGEFTIEVNPDDVTEEKAAGWAKAGVNRVSMGVQSLADEELKLIGRRHNAEDARKAYSILRKHFRNISIDLMFGLPGQTIDSLNETLDGFLSMRPEHISAYSLMYEERTALTRLRDAGKIKETEDVDSVEMFKMINRRLGEAGYERYEISNYALPRHRSSHNSNYWKGLPYLGLGPSAHSYDGDRRRFYNLADISLYIKEQGIVEKEEEILSDEELREEMIMTRLRTAEGLPLTEYESRFGGKETGKLKEKAERFLSSRELLLQNESLTLSESGVMVSDEIISSLF